MTSPLMPGVFPFGTLPDGQDVKLIILSNDLMSVGILTQGAILQDLRIAAVPWSMTIGSDDLAPYLSDMRSAGAVIGPVINRISGGQATLNDRVFEFERNQDGKHTRHSGSAGTNRKLWDLTEVNDTSCTLELSLADGEGGFPGNRAVAVRFRLLSPMTLELRIAATTDADTWINFANHSYWTLDGTDRIDGHELWINAEKYCVADDQDLVTGEVL
ncbi:MAG: galactose mutarotase, partial [Mangrovicoccus sp.]